MKTYEVHGIHKQSGKNIFFGRFTTEQADRVLENFHKGTDYKAKSRTIRTDDFSFIYYE